MSHHKFTGDRSDMAHNIKTERGRRDYNPDELALVRSGREADAKVAWHKRTGR